MSMPLKHTACKKSKRASGPCHTTRVVTHTRLSNANVEKLAALNAQARRYLTLCQQFVTLFRLVVKQFSKLATCQQLQFLRFNQRTYPGAHMFIFMLWKRDICKHTFYHTYRTSFLYPFRLILPSNAVVYRKEDSHDHSSVLEAPPQPPHCRSLDCPVDSMLVSVDQLWRFFSIVQFVCLHGYNAS